MTLRERLAGSRPLVVAHRGDWSAAPENSRAAIAAAGAFDMVEVDVRLSADGVPVLMHDPTLARTAGRPESVRDLVFADLSRTRLSGSRETVPSLAEGLEAAPTGLLFDIDVKDAAELDPVGAFLAGRPERSRVMLKHDVDGPASLSALLSLEARHGIPVIAKVALSSKADIALVERIRDAGVAAAEVRFAHAGLLSAACATGLTISVYTLDEIACDGFSDTAGLRDPAAIWGRLAELGVGLIMTDAPAAVSGFLDETGRSAA